MAATLCLASLISPYGYFYDLVGYSIGMAAVVFRANDRWKPVYALLWLAPGYSGLLAGITGHIFMPVAIMAGAFMTWREATVPQTPPHAHNLASAG
jgi:hypothetical protein